MTTRPHARAAAPEPLGVPLARLTGMVVLAVAAAVTMTGTFLPWLDSGRVTRNSYQVAGTLNRFRLIDSALLDAALVVWPFLGPGLVVAALLLVVRRWRAAGTVAAVVGAIGATGAVTAQLKLGDRGAFGVSLNPWGPSTVTIGGVLLLVGGALLWLPAQRAIRLTIRF